MCLERDADLLVVNDLVENSWVYAFSNRDQVDVWLGLRENVCYFDEFLFVPGPLLVRQKRGFRSLHY